jgi:hypothetical protein
MQKYTDVVTSARSGAAIPSASVTVKTSPGGVTATIYSDDGVTTQANPLTTDSNGEFTFYAADGEYTLTVSGTGITSRTIGPVILHDPADEDEYMPSTDVSFTQSGSATSVSLAKWAQSGVVTAGAPADGIFSSLQDAVDDAVTRGSVVDFRGTWTLSSSLLVREKSDIRGHGRNSVIKIGDGMDDAAIRFTSTSADLLGVHLYGFEIDGNKANQTSTSARGIYFENSGGSSGLIPRHWLQRIYVHDTKGDGIHIGAYLRGSILNGLWVYHCDEYGLHLPGSGDIHVAYGEIGQSGKDGVFLNGTGSVMLSHLKSWFSGRLTAGSNGYFLRNAAQTIGTGLLAQENSGNGFSLWGQSGALAGINLTGCTSDGDNTAASTYGGMSLNNVSGARIDLKVTKFSGASGTPTNAINLTADTINCEINVASDSTSSRIVDGHGVGNNDIKVNGRPLHFRRVSDDFLGDVLADQWNSQAGSDPQAVVAAINSQSGGVVRLTTGDDAAASMAVNGVQMDSGLNWRADTRGLSIEFRVNISAITNVAVFIGFTDQVAALEMPIESAASADTITTNASNAVGIMFDTAMSTDNWWLVGVATNTDATAQNSAVAPTAATFETWRIVLSGSGQAAFFRNGAMIGSVMTGAVTATTLLTPVVAAFSRGAASRNIDLDVIEVKALRGDL